MSITLRHIGRAALAVSLLPGLSAALKLETSANGDFYTGNSRYRAYGGALSLTDGDKTLNYNELIGSFTNRRFPASLGLEGEPIGTRYEEDYAASCHTQMAFWSWFLVSLRGAWERKRYSGLDQRIEVRNGFGASTKWGVSDESPERMRLNNGLLRFLAGPHSMSEQYKDLDDTRLQGGWFGEVVFQQSWTFLRKVWVWDAGYTYSYDDTWFEDGTRSKITLHRTENTLNLKWTDTLSSGLKHKWEQRSFALPGFRRADSQTTVSLSYSFGAAN